MNKLKYFLLALIFGEIAAATAFAFRSPPPDDAVVILEYHRVTDDRAADDDGRAYNVPPAEFSEQLDYLQDNGYHTITMQEYMKARKGKFSLPEKPIILTFDDGYADNFSEMLPILEAHNMKAVVYMIVNNIGRKDYLTWNELKEMQRRGVEIGSHTSDHLPLTTLPENKRRDQVRLSKLLMEWNGINTVFSLSYPNGAYDEELPPLLKSEDYLNAVTGDPGLNTQDTDPYLLRRINIPRPRLGLLEFRFRLFKAELCYWLFD